MRYNTYDVEFYAVVQAGWHWRHYLFHREFILYIDHDALKHLHSQDKVSARHASWIAYLQHFTFVVKHKADALSQRNNLLTAMQLEVSGFDSFRDLLETDPCFSPILAAVRMGERSDFLVHKGFLFKGKPIMCSRL